MYDYLYKLAHVYVNVHSSFLSKTKNDNHSSLKTRDTRTHASWLDMILIPKLSKSYCMVHVFYCAINNAIIVYKHARVKCIFA